MSSTQLAAPLPQASDDLAEVVRKTLDCAPEPLPIAKLTSQLTGPFRRSKQDLQSLLQAEVAAGRIYQYPKFRGSERYWTKDPETYARGVLLGYLSDRALTRSELKQKAKSRLQGLSDKRRTELLDALVKSGDVCKQPPLLGSKTDRFSARPVDPLEYVDDALKKLIKKLEKDGPGKAGVLAAVREFARRNAPAPDATDAQAELAAQTANAAPPAAAAASRGAEQHGQPTTMPASTVVPRQLTEAIIERMSVVHPRAGEGAMVSILELRRAMEFLQLDAGEFDRALWELDRQGRVSLAKHDSPAHLKPEERAELLTDGRGYYYNGISLRTPR